MNKLNVVCCSALIAYVFLSGDICVVNAQSSDSASATSNAQSSTQKLKEEAEMTHCLVDKLRAEVDVDQLLIKKQILEKSAKSQVDSDVQRAARLRVEEDAALAGAKARLAEENLRFLKAQMGEKLTIAETEREMEKIARSKAEEEAAHAGAKARLAEENLRELKAKADILTLNQTIKDKQKI